MSNSRNEHKSTGMLLAEGRARYLLPGNPVAAQRGTGID